MVASRCSCLSQRCGQASNGKKLNRSIHHFDQADCGSSSRYDFCGKECESRALTARHIGEYKDIGHILIRSPRQYYCVAITHFQHCDQMLMSLLL